VSLRAALVRWDACTAISIVSIVRKEWSSDNILTACATILRTCFSMILVTLGRGAALREEIDKLLRCHDTLAQEFEHRLLNGLELIARLLSSQSHAATTPEAAEQLRAAARRITAIGNSQGRPNILDL
jgi:two-component sensor histidine kinase